ncbi:hypothetical protein F511_27649 [Dorcoceras hygrometricum]|uniref:Uncharacterized protein n=1 Tax=Dorcoceras hygrometricum TaxID=472368 RepID=A0A2Z7CXY3_9LAMI|nr:hypothetical protein F511_27649 [Dorcoceras hygrometricum]
MIQQQQFSSDDSAATQIQQRRLHLLHDPGSSTQSKILCTESFTMEIQEGSSRVQGRFHAVTVELRELIDHRIPHTILKFLSQKSNISSRQSAAEILADS